MLSLTAKDATTVPDAAQGRRETIAAVGSHGGLDDLQWLAERGDLKEVETGTQK